MRTQNPLAFKEPGKAAEVWDKRKHLCVFWIGRQPDRWQALAAQSSFFLGRQDTFLSYAWTPTGLIATQLIALLFMLSLRTGNKCP